MSEFHPFHIVSSSPWPVMASLGSLVTVVSLVLFMNRDTLLLPMMVPVQLMILICWWRDVIREGTHQGCHSFEVTTGLRIGMILFIISELMFFFSFFFGWFFSTLNPDIATGSMATPQGLLPPVVWGFPFMNTILLLSSGVATTWFHHEVLFSKKSNQYPLILAIALGIVFLALQWVEYEENSFTISDGIYGSIFYVSTGFHGIHVMIGTLFLVITLMRLRKSHFSDSHHVGMEASIWYWHFVDVVWLFLFVSIYWWGN